MPLFETWHRPFYTLVVVQLCLVNFLNNGLSTLHIYSSGALFYGFIQRQLATLRLTPCHKFKFHSPSLYLSHIKHLFTSLPSLILFLSLSLSINGHTLSSSQKYLSLFDNYINFLSLFYVHLRVHFSLSPASLFLSFSLFILCSHSFSLTLIHYLLHTLCWTLFLSYTFSLFKSCLQPFYSSLSLSLSYVHSAPCHFCSQTSIKKHLSQQEFPCIIFVLQF